MLNSCRHSWQDRKHIAAQHTPPPLSARWCSARVVCMSVCPWNAWLLCHGRPQPPHLPSRRPTEVTAAQAALTVLFYFPDQECVPVLKMHRGCYTCHSCLLAWCTDTTSIEAALALALFAFGGSTWFRGRVPCLLWCEWDFRPQWWINKHKTKIIFLMVAAKKDFSRWWSSTMKKICTRVCVVGVGLCVRVCVCVRVC